MVAAERTVAKGSSVISEFPGVAGDLQNYILTAREVFQRQGAIDFSTMSLVQIRDQLLTRPEVEEAFAVARGMGAGEFFQLMLDRGVLNPEDNQSTLYLDQAGMDAFSVLRFWYRRRVLTYGPSVAAKTVTALYDAAYSSIRAVASIANYIDYPFPAPKPEKPKPSSPPVAPPDPPPVDVFLSHVGGVLDKVVPSSDGVLAADVPKDYSSSVSFTPSKPDPSKPWSFGERGSTALFKKRVAPPPTPLPDSIKPVPGATIGERFKFLAQRDNERGTQRLEEPAVDQSRKVKSQPKLHGRSWEEVIRQQRALHPNPRLGISKGTFHVPRV